MHKQFTKRPSAEAESSWQRGKSLTREYYTSQQVFDRDLAWITTSQWLIVDHVSRIPNPGDFFLLDVGAESIIILRISDNAFCAFYNVCRHRGSRICLKPEGHVRMLTCPYHAWNYNLNGSLRGAPNMDRQFDKSSYGLRQVHIRESFGFLFVNLSKGSPPDFEAYVKRHRAILEFSQLDKTKVAVRKRYPTNANWKLVVENFLECYHCRPAHPTYCSVHDRLKLRALGAGLGSGLDEDMLAYQPILKAWEQRVQALGHPVGYFADTPDSEFLQQAARTPIGSDFLTETLTGRAAAPLLGLFQSYDGGRSGSHFNPLSVIVSTNDFAVMIRFTPRSVTLTDVEALWLVRADACEGDDYDPAEISHVWDVTLSEDKTIVENNQLGVNSAAYEPGPHSYMEGRVSDFLEWYLSKTAEPAPAVPWRCSSSNSRPQAPSPSCGTGLPRSTPAA